MNKARRAALEKVIEAVEAAKTDLESLEGEERDFYDNMPDSLRDGEKGTAAEQNADDLQEAIESFDEITGKIREAIDR